MAHTANELQYRIRFEKRALDGNGDLLGPWTEAATQAAKIMWLRGTQKAAEPVMADRLQGLKPAVIVVRACAASRAIDNSYRAVDARLAQPGPNDYFAVHASDVTADRMWVEILVERGADG